MTARPPIAQFGDAIEVKGERPSWLPDDLWNQVEVTLFCGEVQQCRDEETNPDMSDWEWSDIEAIKLPVPRYDFVYLALERGMVPWFADAVPADIDTTKPVLFEGGCELTGWGYLAVNGKTRRIIGYTRKATSTALPLAHPAAPQGEEVVAQIVSWLRHQSDLGANRGNEADKGTTKRAAFGGGSLALKRAADAIESGEYLTNDNALAPAAIASGRGEGE